MILARDEFCQFLVEARRRHLNILKAIKTENKSSAVLSGKLGTTDRTIKEYYALLKRYNLIDAIPGLGIGLTEKGEKFLNWYERGVIDEGYDESSIQSEGFFDRVKKWMATMLWRG